MLANLTPEKTKLAFPFKLAQLVQVEGSGSQAFKDVIDLRDWRSANLPLEIFEKRKTFLSENYLVRSKLKVLESYFPRILPFEGVGKVRIYL